MATRKTPPKKLWKLIFQLADCLHQTCSSVHSPEEIKKFHDMPLSQIHMIKKVRMLTLEEAEGINLKVLAQELGISAAAASEQVNILVNKGMLCREQSPLDRRAVCIKLSEDAFDKFNKVECYLDHKTEEFLKEISPAEAEVLTSLLDRYNHKMESLKASLPHEKEF